jgi:hypothetical protein
VDYQVLVRILHSGANSQEQPEPIVNRQLAGIAILVNRLALHQLHHQIRKSGIGRPSVQQARDVRVIEVGQDLSLGSELGKSKCSTQPLTDNFDRDLLFILLVGADAPIHRPHPALAHQIDDFISSNSPPNPGVRQGSLKHRAGPQRCFQKPFRARFLIHQQRFDFNAQGFVAVACLVQESSSMRRRNFEHLLQYTLHLLPALGSHCLIHIRLFTSSPAEELAERNADS